MQMFLGKYLINKDMILEKLKEYIDYKGISVSAFEKMIGMSNASFGRSLKNGGAIGTDKLENILNTCTDINPQWLLTGEPPMLKSEMVPANSSGDKNIIPAHVTTAINIERKHNGIPLIPIDAIAGFPDTDTPGITIEDCDHYIIPEFRSLKVEFLIRVSGSSMYPKYSNGDILACRKVKSSGFLQWGKVYVLDTEQGALVKRLFEDRDNPDCIICHSDNTERYPDFKIPKVEIRSYSIVVGAIRVE